MRYQADILGKTVVIESTPAADQALDARTEPLNVEMELYFSCLLRKAVRFDPSHQAPFSVSVTPNLLVSFRPIATKVCKAEEFDDEPPVADFPIVKPEAFVPKKLSLDYRHGQWVGEFMLA